VRIREWASVKGEKEGLYKDEGGVYRNTRPLCTAAACTATRVLSSTLGPYSEILYALSFPLEY